MCRKRIISGPIAILIAFLFLFLYLPLEADENESKADLSLNEYTETKTKNIDLIPVSLEKRSSISLKSFQLTEKGTKPYQIKLDFSPKQIDINPGSRQVVKKPNNSSNFFYTSSLITLTCLNIADYYTTVKALKHKNLEELNPLMKPFTKNTALYTTVKLGLTVCNYYLLKSLYKKDKTLAWAVSLVSNFVFSYVVANNIRRIQEAQSN